MPATYAAAKVTEENINQLMYYARSACKTDLSHLKDALELNTKNGVETYVVFTQEHVVTPKLEIMSGGWFRKMWRFTGEDINHLFDEIVRL